MRAPVCFNQPPGGTPRLMYQNQPPHGAYTHKCTCRFWIMWRLLVEGRFEGLARHSLWHHLLHSWLTCWVCARLAAGKPHCVSGQSLENDLCFATTEGSTSHIFTCPVMWRPLIHPLVAEFGTEEDNWVTFTRGDWLTFDRCEWHTGRKLF